MTSHAVVWLIPTLVVVDGRVVGGHLDDLRAALEAPPALDMLVSMREDVKRLKIRSRGYLDNSRQERRATRREPWRRYRR